MRDMLLLFFVFCLLSEVPATLMPEPSHFIRRRGYCMWYGVCGISEQTRKPINCLYNDKAKNIDNKSREILFQLCPEIVQENRGACCDHQQLLNFRAGMQSGQEMMAHCPACWKNFRQLYCQMICSPDNSLFIDPTGFTQFEEKTAITSINYYVHPSFRNGLYRSCKDVLFTSTLNPYSNKKVMSFMCGSESCSPLRFLRYIGDPAMNGVSPFKVGYPSNAPQSVVAMNVIFRTCNETVFEPYSNKTNKPCLCRDCVLKSCVTINSPPDPWHNSSLYRRAQMVFTIKTQSKRNNMTCYHNFYEKACIITGPVLTKKFLYKILQVQQYLSKMKVEFIDPKQNSSYTTLADVCAKSRFPRNNNCVIISALEYWQNDERKLNACIGALLKDRCWITPTAFVAEASWGDHLVACVWHPTASDDTTPLHQSCVSSFGDPIIPSDVFGRYKGKNYLNASALIVTFIFKNRLDTLQSAKAQAWENKFIDYLRKFEDKDLQVAYEIKSGSSKDTRKALKVKRSKNFSKESFWNEANNFEVEQS